LTRGDVDRAIASFNQWGAAANQENLRFAYHIHGYEFQAGPDGTLMDVLFKGTDPQHVDYEMDIFWVVRGGGNPVTLLDRYGNRIRLVHLKDIARGTPTNDPTGQAPDEASVTLGTGLIDIAAVLKAAVKAKVKWFIRDRDAAGC
jgi:sugar phosphate isomerase/epimerase